MRYSLKNISKNSSINGSYPITTKSMSLNPPGIKEYKSVSKKKSSKNKATSVSPTIPVGRFSIRKIGTARLKFGFPSKIGRLEIKFELSSE